MTSGVLADQGGLLLCANEGASDEFAKSVYLLAREMYPMYEFRNLPQDHPIYTANFPVEGFDDPIRGLSNGARELIVVGAPRETRDVLTRASR